MNIRTNTIGIIADDLTGANDTALQFHISGCNTQILLDYSVIPPGTANTQAWAISTETRNAQPEEAVETVAQAAKVLVDSLNVDYLYKKIDSTLRGNIANECLTVLNSLDWDAAVIVPAFPSEGRTTVGGYHLLKGVPIERTEVARDPQSPICESHIPTLLKQQIKDPDLVAHIQLKTVMRGAGPILVELKELVKKQKKLIVIDAVSTTDMEQISLAIEKSNLDILPCGSAGLAQALTKSWLPEMKHQHIAKTIPSMPILIVSGSTTDLNRTQIKKFIESDEIEAYALELKPEQLLNDPSSEIIDKICERIESERLVLLYSTPLDGDTSKTIAYANENDIQLQKVAGVISDNLSKITKNIVEKENNNVVLILLGGETSFKCCYEIDSKHLQLIDEVEPVIPLCLDYKAQWIVTKSGNLGGSNTLTNIVKFILSHQEKN